MAQLSVIHEYSRNDSVLLIGENADTLLFPFAGGMNSCQFANIDINLDGTDDILVFDRHGNKILPFLVLAGSHVKYRFAPEYASQFPPLEQWVQAVDYNNDGKKDIFTYTTGGIKVYRNDSETRLKFTLVTNPYLLSMQGTTLTNILVTYADYPAITDIDSDGDLDILTFWGLGSFVEWHRNTSMELNGKPDSLTFVKASSCWGHFAEGNEDNTIVLDTCATGDSPGKIVKSHLEDPKHTGSTLLVNDLNGDGLPDITIGDVDFSQLVHLLNGGTPADARMVSQTNAFPGTADPVNMNSFPAAMLTDVNNDGIKDLLVSPFEPSLTKSKNFKSISLYLNIGSSSQPLYNKVPGSFLQDEMLDLGSGAYPVFFDYNGDGLQDILVGNYGYSDTCIYSPLTGLQCTFTAKVALLLNTGTASKPSFRLADRNIAHLDSLHMQSLIPSLADMDGDGDADLVCGNSLGKLVYCENRALPGQPASFKCTDASWYSIDAGDFAAPQLRDMDNDGLTDIVCGKRNGTLNYYKNTGNKTEPDFFMVSDHLGGVDVTNTQLSNYGYSVPYFYKDNLGTTYLFVGSEFGDVFVYDQVDNNLDGTFRLLGTVPKVKEGWRTAVAIGKLNSDTLSDMLIGNYSGGLGLYFGNPGKLFGIHKASPALASALSIFPNPAKNEIRIKLKVDINPDAGLIQIRTMTGETLMKYPHSILPLQIDVSHLNNGIYLITYETLIGIDAAKLVICR